MGNQQVTSSAMDLERPRQLHIGALVTEQARALGAAGPVDITDRAIIVEGLDEPPRYFLQHGFGYQVHDRAKPPPPARPRRDRLDCAEMRAHP